MTTPLPVILCGATSKMATNVKGLLEPEIEAIHVILRLKHALTEIPQILATQKSPLPSTSSSPNIGTQNFTSPPVAVIVGAGYEIEAVEEMRAACRGEGKKTIPFLICDLSIPRPPLGPEYGPAIVERVKRRARELEGEGKLGSGDELFYY